MKLKELLTVIDNNTYLNIVSETKQWLYALGVQARPLCGGNELVRHLILYTSLCV